MIRPRRTATLAMLTSAALIVGATTPLAHADSVAPIGDEAPASAQPRFSGYRLQEIRDWSPETDPYAEFLRAEVPLQPRISPNPATQANPALESRAEVMLMQGDYGNAFFNTPIANNDYGNLTLSFWQYADYFSPWHGAATASTPSSLYDPKTSDWRNRGFEFGIVNIPNPAYTNAAHRNGVKSIATIYFDPAFRPGLTFKESFDKDPDSKGYVIAQKLIEMAKYYGYDGYFLNQEEHGDDSEFKPFMAYLTKQGLYTQWYDTHGTFDAAKAAWLEDDEHGQIHNSVFVNYPWPSSIDRSLQFIKDNPHYDAFKEVFFGVEANQGKFSGRHSSSSELPRLYAPGTKNPRGSVALFTPSDYYQRGLDGDVQLPDGKTSRPPHQTDQLQWMIHERERMFFSGVKSDPRDTGKKPGYARPEVGVSDASQWVGVADFTPARSVIQGSQFHTDFNTGHGVQTFIDGKPAGGQWTDIATQSILPSWQWWIDTAGTRPHVDFDYGRAEQRWDVRGNDTNAPFRAVGAYRGGSSLVIHGTLDAPAELRLFKTDLDIRSSSRLTLTHRHVAGASAPFKVALRFKDTPEDPVLLEVPDSGAVADGWTTSTLDLSAYQGRKVAAIGFSLPKADGYQLNVGALAVGTGAKAPAKPEGLCLRKVFADGQAVLAWSRGEFTDVDGYEVTAVAADGSRTALGGGYTSLLHVKGVPTKDKVQFEVRAVGKDGQRSEPAIVAYDFSKHVRELAIAEAKSASGLLTHATERGKVSLTWAGAANGRCLVELRLVHEASGNIDNQPYGAAVPCSDRKATIEVPVLEGYTFDATVTPAGEELGVSLRGRTHDAQATMIPRSDLVLDGNSFQLRTPTTRDWWKVSVAMLPSSGDPQVLIPEVKRGDNSNRGLTEPRQLIVRDGTLKITLTDYSGNVSEQTFPVRDGKFLDDQQAPRLSVEGPSEQVVELGTAIQPVTVQASDEAAPVTLSLKSELPAGLQWRGTLGGQQSPGGILSGTPTEPGTHKMEVIARDANGNEEIITLAITVTRTPKPEPTPTVEPSIEPSVEPTVEPSATPTVEPAPTNSPSANPTAAPSPRPGLPKTGR